MKRLFVLLLFPFFLFAGCNLSSEIDGAMSLRERVLSSDGLAFQANITADYGDFTQSFSLDCKFDREGTMNFTVISPESINGITGFIEKDKGRLTFDDKALLFELMADEQITPVSAPWVAIQALRSGYIQSCGAVGENLKLIIDDSYDVDALQVDYIVTKDMVPVSAEIYWQNRRILELEIISFNYL